MWKCFNFCRLFKKKKSLGQKKKSVYLWILTVVAAHYEDTFRPVFTVLYLGRCFLSSTLWTCSLEWQSRSLRCCTTTAEKDWARLFISFLWLLFTKLTACFYPQIKCANVSVFVPVLSWLKYKRVVNCHCWMSLDQMGESLDGLWVMRANFFKSLYCVCITFVSLTSNYLTVFYLDIV